MKQRRPVRVLVAAAITSAAFGALVQSASAGVIVPRLANSYQTWLSRAMDDCVSPTLTITTPNFPSGGCPQTNANTDTSIKMNFGTLLVSKNGKVVLLMRGATPADQVNVVLTLRASLPTKTTQHGATKVQVTFPDQQATCGPFVAGFNGAIVGVSTLTSCLGASASGLSVPTGTTNLEVVGARVDKVGGLPVAVGGVLR